MVAPLSEAACEAEVVAIVAQPEQIMWLSMATSYYTGHRHDFHASGYNAQCVETTLLPMTTGEINISFGCYGCRASSDVGDDCMMMGIPVELMPQVIKLSLIHIFSNPTRRAIRTMRRSCADAGAGA